MPIPFLKRGDTAIVTFIPKKPFVVEVFADFPSIGRFCMRRGHDIIAVGAVKQVLWT